MNKNIDHRVGVVRNKVAGVRSKSHETAIGTQTQAEAVIIALRAGGGDTDAFGGSGVQIMDKDILGAIGVAGDEIGCIGNEGDDTAV